MKKGKKKQDSDSSSSSSSSDDSSDSSSESSKSESPSPKKSKKSVVKKKHSKKSHTSSSSSSSEEDRSHKKKPVSNESIKARQKEVEHSKWDSPVEKIDKKRKAETKDISPHDKDNRRDNERRDNDRREHNRRSGERQKEMNRDRREDDRGRYNNEREHNNRNYNDRRNNDDRGYYNRRERFDNRDRQNDRRDDRRNDDRRNDDRRNDDRRNDDRRNEEHRSRNDSRERSPVRENRNKHGFDRRRNNRRRSNSFDHAKASWGRDNSSKDSKDNKKDKEKPNFGLSGKLTEETNTFKGVVIKYSEPPEARKPKRRWRLYPFKGEKAMQTLYIHRESAYLIGRDRKVVDLAVDHPSCSKQHAALQYRLVTFTRDDGSTGKRVRPYLIDLDSANGTHINNKQIESRKYVELLERDVIKFGYSSREYVLLHENSKDEAMDDDVKVEEEAPVKEEPED